MRLAVAGGTGLLGRLVVAEGLRRGHGTVVLSRSSGVDVETGEGVEAALAGCDAVVDATNVVTLSRDRSVAFFEAASRHLTEAGARCGVGHHLVVSIVGVDRVPVPYYAGKVRQEEVALSSGVPTTVLRATQFHEFPGQLVDRASWGPLTVLPRMRIRPVAAREVAAHLVTLAEGPPLGRGPEIAGPEVHLAAGLARRLVRARGDRRLVVGVPLPGVAGRGMRGGGLLPTGDVVHGTVRFDEWLVEGVARR